MKIKEFDCVEMKHQAGRKIYEDLMGKTVEEQIEYWKKVSEKFKRRREESSTRALKESL